MPPPVTIIKPGPNYYVSGSRARKAGGTNGNFDAVVVSSAVFVGAGVVEWGVGVAPSNVDQSVVSLGMLYFRITTKVQQCTFFSIC